MKKLLLSLSLCALCASARTAAAQTNAPALPTPPTIGVITNADSLFGFALNVLPAWDRTVSVGPASFNAKELEFSAAGAWKSVTAAGLSPYGNIGGTYFFTRNLGGGADMTLFNNGAGSGTMDSASLDLILRAPAGNVAGYAIAGPTRDFHLGRWGGALGLGLEYRYNTGIGLFLDTRYQMYGRGETDNSFLTRLGLTLHF